MKQEQKDLLLKELCARLPYRPKIWFAESNSNDNLKSIWYDDLEGWQVDGDNLSAPVYEVKPYLFPLSSLNEEQIRKWKSYDYFYKNHIDIRGLIPMGLANNATGLNIY